MRVYSCEQKIYSAAERRQSPDIVLEDEGDGEMDQQLGSIMRTGHHLRSTRKHLSHRQSDTRSNQKSILIHSRA